MAVRAQNLAAAFPKYDPRLVMEFSEAVYFYDTDHGIFGRRHI
jgi:hypothetical protein